MDENTLTARLDAIMGVVDGYADARARGAHGRAYAIGFKVMMQLANLRSDIRLTTTSDERAKYSRPTLDYLYDVITIAAAIEMNDEATVERLRAPGNDK